MFLPNILDVLHIFASMVIVSTFLDGTMRKLDSRTFQAWSLLLSTGFKLLTTMLTKRCFMISAFLLKLSSFIITQCQMSHIGHKKRKKRLQ